MINRQKTNPEDVKKLPKWAQREIGVLESEIERLKTQVAQIEGKEESDIKIEHGSEFRNLPKHSRIRYVLPSGKVEIIIRDDELEVTAYNGHLCVLPQACNMVHVIVKER